LTQYTIFDYLDPDTGIILDEPKDIKSGLELYIRRWQESIKEAPEKAEDLKSWSFLESQELQQLLEQRPVIYHSFFPAVLYQ
jgi:hypothetical protein